jgi:TPP-dependent pyruvate/acetoin dehydrogenase alpha subunit
VSASVTSALELELYARMLLIRRFEEAAYRAYEQGEIAGTIHVSIGQEAVAVGVVAALEEHDTVLSHHRAHGHALAKGVDPGRLFAELFGRRAGVSGGKGGSMHVTDVSVGFLGSLAVVGGAVPLAVGIGLAERLRGRGAICVAFFGDGAINQGILYESLNLAAIWSLPVLFVCENNGFAISVRSDYATAGAGLVARAQAFGLPARSVDGQELGAVRRAALELVAGCRGGRPALRECRTYRFLGHSRGDPAHGVYRSEQEVETWRARDPLVLHASEAELAEADLRRLEAEVEAAIERALAFARASEPPGEEELTRDVWGP